MTQPGAVQFPVTMDGPADAVAFTADSARVACGGATSTIEIQPTRAGTPRSLPCQGSVSALAFSPDGKSLAAADFDVVRIFDTQAATDAAIIRVAAQQSVNWVKYTPDGGKLIAATDTHIGVFDPRKLDPPLAEWDLDEKIAELDLSSDGTMLAAAVDQQHGGDHHNAGYAVVFDLTTRTERARLTPGAPVQHVAFAPDGATVVCSYPADPTGVADGTAATFSVPQSGTAATQLAQPNGWTLPCYPSGLAYGSQPDGDVVLVGGSDGTAVVLDASDATQISRGEHDGAVTYVALATNGRWAASIGIDDFVQVFSATTQAPPLYKLQIPEARSMAFSPDDKWLAVGHLNGMTLFANTDAVTVQL